MRLSKLVILVLLLASCQVFGGGEESSTGNNAAAASGSIQWERDPLEVVFRADIVGGEDQDSFFRKNNVPDCTVYGDNRVVWDNEALRGEAQILWDRVSDAVIRNFIGELTVNYRIFTYDAQADLEPPSSVAPVVEVITLRVNDMVHRTDAFGGWPSDYYNDILALCQSLAQAPTLFEPDSAWISARAIPYNPSLPSVLWDGEAAGLDLSALAESGEPRWETGRNVRVLWNMIHSATPDLQFNQGTDNFYVAVQVPGVTRDAPAPPSDSGS